MAANKSYQTSRRKTDTADNAPAGWLHGSRFGKALPALRLFLRMWLVVFIVTFVGFSTWDLHKQAEEHATKIDASIDRVLLAWQAGADSREFLDVADTAELGKQFSLHDVILGGRIFGPTGGILGSFGQSPELSWQNVHIDQISFRDNAQDKTIDVALPALETGLTYEVILRIPGPGHQFSKLQKGLTTWQRVIRDSVASFFIAIAVSGLLLMFILKPNWMLQQAAFKASSAKMNADSYRLKWRRKDTLGLTAKAVDTLIARLHYTRESELAPFRHAYQKSGLPILKFNANGRLNDANDAAAKFLEKEHPSKLKEMDFTLTTIPGHQRGTPLELCRSQPLGHYHGQIMLQTANGKSRICFADITTMAPAEARKNAAIQVVLFDATDFFTRLVTKEEEAKMLAIADREAQRREKLLRRQLEAFASLATPAPVKGEDAVDKSVFISMERIINEWYQETLEGGPPKDMLEHSALEAVSGDPDIVRNLVRQAYNTVFLLGGDAVPKIKISSALVRGGMAEFTVEQIEDGTAHLATDPDELMSWIHNYHAFEKALKEADGQLIFFDPDARPVKLILRLPAFRTASHNAKPVPREDVEELLQKTG